MQLIDSIMNSRLGKSILDHGYSIVNTDRIGIDRLSLSDGIRTIVIEDDRGNISIVFVYNEDPDKEHYSSEILVSLVRGKLILGTSMKNERVANELCTLLGDIARVFPGAEYAATKTILRNYEQARANALFGPIQ